jgi:D-glycero-alpha-D-manno-heptose-7-phosphate kinase
VKEPIGKQDQYAAAFGGLNIFQFNADESVDVTPVRLDYKRRHDFQDHLILFYTGLTRSASSVLIEQKANIQDKLDTLKEMSNSVFEFRTKLLAGNFIGLGEMLHEGWLKKKTLALNVSNRVIDDLYATGMSHGAWGGKVLGAGGGGCVLFIASPEKQAEIKEAMAVTAKKNNLEDFAEVPMKFVQAGAEILMNNDHAGQIASV